MAWLKIPCLLIATFALHKAISPPQRPPRQDEEVSSTSFEILLKQRWTPLVVKILCDSAATAEISVILSALRPEWNIPGYVLRFLVFEGDASLIHISSTFIVGTLLCIAGGIIRCRCYQELGTMFTFEMCVIKEHKLVTTGPYSIVRHPGYAGLILAVSGVPCMHACWGSWLRSCGVLNTTAGMIGASLYLILVTSVVLALLQRMWKEDNVLRDKFGKDWDAWAKRVPWRLVPGVI